MIGWFSDKPWIWDIPYTDLPDRHGNMWCPSWSGPPNIKVIFFWEYVLHFQLQQLNGYRSSLNNNLLFTMIVTFSRTITIVAFDNLFTIQQYEIYYFALYCALVLLEKIDIIRNKTLFLNWKAGYPQFFRLLLSSLHTVLFKSSNCHVSLEHFPSDRLKIMETTKVRRNPE